MPISQDVNHKRADNLHNHESHRPATAIVTIQDSAHEFCHKDAAVNSIQDYAIWLTHSCPH